MHVAYIHSPIGWIEIKGNENGISSLIFVEENEEKNTNVHPTLKKAVLQITDYLNGKRTVFDVKINPEGTDFQKNVWQKLSEIPFGKTVSYLDIAIALGDKNATRAVGNANGKNPISIIVPCHRVVGTNGKMTGYAGGLWRKEWLLHHEKKGSLGEQKQLFSL
ncbi:MAG TPA: methylated-DNA--[protein]-cysteine S-methyltransferase [Bacteroidia bacterium]|nr:methylated-DNA--[protein]-cysteine S-methyltransferase [Bacteroidia bacterium]